MQSLDGRQLKLVTISIALSVAAYLAFSLWAGFNDVVKAFAQIGILGAAAVLGMSIVNYGLRFIRWHCYLQAMGHDVPVRPSLQIYLSGFALTTTPGKAGETIRGIFLTRYAVPFTSTFAAFFSERLSDLIAIILLTLAGLSKYPDGIIIIIPGLVGMLIIFLLLSKKPAIEQIKQWSQNKPGKIGKLLNHGAETLLLARNCHTAKLQALSLILSLAAWGAEAIAFYWALQWLGVDISLSFAVFVYAISMLAGALSFLPGGLGSAEAVMTTLLVFKGMPMPDAIAATVFTRLATLWFAVVIGLAALLSKPGNENAA